MKVLEARPGIADDLPVSISCKSLRTSSLFVTIFTILFSLLAPVYSHGSLNFLARFGPTVAKNNFILLAANLFADIQVRSWFFNKILFSFLFFFDGRISDNDFQNLFESFLCSSRLSITKFTFACFTKVLTLFLLLLANVESLRLFVLFVLDSSQSLSLIASKI